MKFTFVIDPIAELDPCHDTSVALMEAAQNLGHDVYITKFSQLSILDGQAWAYLQSVKLVPVELSEGRWVVESPWYQLGESFLKCLDEMDAVFVRTDPPFDVSYLHATYILDYIDVTKTLVINSLKGLRSANDKVYPLKFKEYIPKTIVSSDTQVIRTFLKKERKVVLKPLIGKGGEGIVILEVGDQNVSSLISMSTNQGRVPVIVQAFLPEVRNGDKRIILLDGEPIGAINRLSKNDDFRCNMAAGGAFEKADITEKERQLCAHVGAILKQDGLYFVGIDIIGGLLTEVNVTTPTGIREIDLLNNVKLAEKVINWAGLTCQSLKQA